MKNTNYLTEILNYIFEPRFTRALLIDGEWGCGKSYFVKNQLVPEIEKKETDESSKDKKAYYKVLLISLYGLSTIESIQDLMYTVMLEKYALTLKGIDDDTCSLVKNISMLGSKVFQGIGRYLNVEQSIKDISSQVAENFLSSQKKNIVLIFDDFERCQVDVIELMGFFNNLCENNGYRVILIANENEIAKNNDKIEKAIQQQIALQYLIEKKAHGTEREISQRKRTNQSNYSIDKKSLDNQLSALFDNDILYKRTREKLIGHTIKYEADIESVYESIAKAIGSPEIREYLIKSKEIITNIFHNLNHKNLRTLISIFIAIDKITGAIKTKQLSDVEEDCKALSIDINVLIDSEKKNILSYITQTAIEIVNGSYYNRFDLGKEMRYGVIEYSTGVKPGIGYAFVDDYWSNLVADHEVINNDFNQRINELLMREIQRQREQEYFEMSLFKLEKWYALEDEIVKENILLMKQELTEKKYKPREFKDIICVLLKINNANFGLTEKYWNRNATGKIYDSFEDVIIVPEKIDNVIETNIYNKWEEVNINEYIKSMMQYFDDDKFEINREMLRMICDDAEFAMKYQNCVQPILDEIEKREIKRIRSDGDNTELFDKQIDDILNYFKTHAEEFISYKHFFSLYGFDNFNNLVLNCSTEEIYKIVDAIKSVYSFNNLNEFFSADFDVVYKLWESLKKDRADGGKIYNEKRSRTRAIALMTMENNFGYYKRLLKGSNKTDKTVD